MASRRYVGHAINVQSVYPTNLTSDVGTSTSESVCLTSTTTALAKSSPSDTVWIVEGATYALPIAPIEEDLQKITYTKMTYLCLCLPPHSQQHNSSLCWLSVLHILVQECAAVRCPWIPTAAPILFSIVPINFIDFCALSNLLVDIIILFAYYYFIKNI